MDHRSLSRRNFIISLSLGAAASAMATKPGAAAGTEKLSVKDPAAAALGYVEDAAQVDSKKYPAFVKGSTCENCLQLQGKVGEAYRPCSVFPGKLVAVVGWCSSWTAEM